jgi:hypothetical protein
LWVEILMRRSSGSLAVLFVSGLLLCSLVAPAIGAAQGSTERAAAAEPVPMTQGIDADRTEFRITVYANGSAEWLFRYEQRLESDEERQDFETFAEEFNSQETEAYRNFQERAVSLTASGTNATGREMSAEDFDRDARIEELAPAGNEFGIVEMSFRWEGFAETDGDRVAVGDTFEGGLYVGPDQRLVFERGPELRFESIQPEDGILSGEDLIGSDTVTWEGERSFTDNRPRVILIDADATPAPTPTATSATPVASTPGWLLPIGVLALVLLLGIGAGIAYRAGMIPPDDGGTAAESADDTGGGSDSGAGSTAPVPEPELMSDEERVVSLLEERGGRMKQVNIVDETGWSKSKVSMLLSDMEEDGTVSKLRVGRENIVSLSGQEPDAAGSPFDDEE